MAKQPQEYESGADERKADASKDQQREAAFKAGEKQRAEEHQAEGKRREAVQKYLDARRKEDERRAALSPPERLAEDEKRAAMTAEDRAKEDESKGLTQPELRSGETPTQYAATPQFPIQTETPHPAEFILSEANGQLSRDVATVAIGDSVSIGQTLKITTPATLTAPAVVTGNVTTDTACDAIALYKTPVSTVAQNIAVLTRNAEVNGNLLYYPATITGADKLNIAKALLAHNIAVRV